MKLFSWFFNLFLASVGLLVIYLALTDLTGMNHFLPETVSNPVIRIVIGAIFVVAIPFHGLGKSWSIADVIGAWAMVLLNIAMIIAMLNFTAAASAVSYVGLSFFTQAVMFFSALAVASLRNKK